MAFYSAYKVVTLIQMGDSQIVQYTVEDNFDSDSAL